MLPSPGKNRVAGASRAAVRREAFCPTCSEMKGNELRLVRDRAIIALRFVGVLERDELLHANG